MENKFTAKDVIDYLEKNKDDEEIKSYLSGYEREANVDVELVKELADNDKEIRSWLDSIKDSHASKALETWKENHLEKIIEEAKVAEMSEEEQENMAIKKLQAQVDQMQMEKNLEVQRNLALKTAQSKRLPTGLVDFFIGSTDEETLENLSTLEKVFNESLQKNIKAKLKDTSYTPPKSGDNKKFTVEDLADMTPEEINAFYEEQLNNK